MLKHALAVVGLLCSLWGAPVAALELPLTVSEQVLRERIQGAGPLARSWGQGMLTVSSGVPSALRVGTPAGRIWLELPVTVSVAGGRRSYTGLISGHAALRYARQETAFYLDDPVLEAIRVERLPQPLQSLATRAVQELVRWAVRSPVYRLRPDASFSEGLLAKRLRTVKVESGQLRLEMQAWP